MSKAELLRKLEGFTDNTLTRLVKLGQHLERQPEAKVRILPVNVDNLLNEVLKLGRNGTQSTQSPPDIENQRRQLSQQLKQFLEHTSKGDIPFLGIRIKAHPHLSVTLNLNTREINWGLEHCPKKRVITVANEEVLRDLLAGRMTSSMLGDGRVEVAWELLVDLGNRVDMEAIKRGARE